MVNLLVNLPLLVSMLSIYSPLCRWCNCSDILLPVVLLISCVCTVLPVISVIMIPAFPLIGFSSEIFNTPSHGLG